MTDRIIIIRKPDDWHLHVRDLEMMRKSWVVPDDIKVEGPEERALIYRGGETLAWQVTVVS